MKMFLAAVLAISFISSTGCVLMIGCDVPNVANKHDQKNDPKNAPKNDPKHGPKHDDHNKPKADDNR